MKNNIIVTIDRQYGSGGRTIGKLVADELNLTYLDNELIKKSAQKSGYSQELFENAEQKPTGSLLYSMSMFASSGLGFELPLSDKVFLIQSEVIKEAADTGNCVIVGRCADYILSKHENVVNIFIHGDFENRVSRAVCVYNCKESEAKDTVLKNDKRRASYYNFYTNAKWGASSNYHLSINSNILGVEKTAAAIVRFLKDIK